MTGGVVGDFADVFGLDAGGVGDRVEAEVGVVGRKQHDLK
jgi:hypothetical protein